jgi:ATPase family associated with various cellular activities (AAA)
MNFELGLKAKIPILAVHTDDLVYLEDTLMALSGKKVQEIDQKFKISTATLYADKLLYTRDAGACTPSMYLQLREMSRTLVLVNGKSDQAVDCGMLSPSHDHVLSVLKEYSPLPAGLAKQVRGMSIKAVHELVTLASAMTGKLDQKSLRHARSAMGQSIQGLYPMEIDMGYYEPLPELDSWMETNLPYFLSEKAPKALVPRGLLFDGPPGTGKTLGAKQVAKYLDVPLYRLDISSTLNRYIGESEQRLRQQLQLLDKEEPCVVLLDEAEKVFGQASDNPVIERMLSQLLWWMNEHTSRVFTIMTTNNKAKLPPELYRPGRIDRVMHVGLLNAQQAKQFAGKLLVQLLPTKPTLKQLHHFSFVDGPNAIPRWSYADVTALVVHEIKENKWISS